MCDKLLAWRTGSRAFPQRARLAAALVCEGVCEGISDVATQQQPRPGDGAINVPRGQAGAGGCRLVQAAVRTRRCCAGATATGASSYIRGGRGAIDKLPGARRRTMASDGAIERFQHTIDPLDALLYAAPSPLARISTHAAFSWLRLGPREAGRHPAAGSCLAITVFCITAPTPANHRPATTTGLPRVTSHLSPPPPAGHRAALLSSTPHPSGHDCWQRRPRRDHIMACLVLYPRTTTPPDPAVMDKNDATAAA